MIALLLLAGYVLVGFVSYLVIEIKENINNIRQGWDIRLLAADEVVLFVLIWPIYLGANFANWCARLKWSPRKDIVRWAVDRITYRERVVRQLQGKD